MSWATRALILMHLEARPGAWCSAENIAAAQQIEPAECEAACNELSAAGLVDGQLEGDGRANPPRFRALSLPDHP